MASQGNSLYNLATIIKRLEAVASRIEDVADIQEQRAGIVNPNAASSQASSQVSSQATPAPVPPPPPPPPPAVEDPKAFTVYDETIIKGKLDPFTELTESLDCEKLKEQVDEFVNLFKEVGEVIKTAGNCIQPSQEDILKIVDSLKPLFENVSNLKEENSWNREWSNHFSSVAAGAICIKWVIEVKPGSFIETIKDETQFHAYRVINEYKDKDAKHVKWARDFMALLGGLKEYVGEYHATELSWNPKGIPLSEYKKFTVGAPQPPPPPPAPVQTPDSGGGVAAVFAELNRGSDVTKGLRKVEKSEMTHKNPALRASSTVPSNTSSAKKPTKPVKPQSLSTKKPPKFAYEGKKWIIEYQENEQALTVDGANNGDVVSLYGCKNTIVAIKGKVNGVSIVNCTKTSVLVDSVISSVTVTASQSFIIQITGSVPTVQLDSTDSGQIFLSKHCLGVEIFTAKCSAINVSLPVEGEEEGVFVEKPIPEMLRTTVQNGALVTAIVEHMG